MAINLPPKSSSISIIPNRMEVIMKDTFLVIAVSVLSFSLIAAMDFENLSVLDYGVIFSTIFMWSAYIFRLIKKRK